MTRLAVAAWVLLQGVAVAGPLVVVSNEDGNDLALIDIETDVVVARIDVGKRPRGVRASGDGRLLWVALSGSPKAPPGRAVASLAAPDRAADGIGEVDLATRALKRIVQAGQDPETFDRVAGGLVVSNEETGEASFVDLAAGRVTRRIAVGDEPEGVTARPDGKVVYVTSEAENRVTAIDLPAWRIAGSFTTGARPRAVVFSPDGKRAFISCEKAGELAVADAQRHTLVKRIALPRDGATTLGPMPMGLALSPDGRRLYVSNGRGGTISVVDARALVVLHTFSAGGTRPWGVGVSPDGRKLYTANGPSNDVSVLDATTGTLLKRLPTGKSPWGIAVVP
jgi:YVTN family beta-propeller protein